MALAIFFTGDLPRECAFSSRTSAFDQVRRLVRLARLLAISHPYERHAAAATLTIAEPARDEKTVEHFAQSDRSASTAMRSEVRGASSFDHLVGEREKLVRNLKAECLGGLGVNDEFEFCWLLDRQISHAAALQDTINIGGLGWG
jgi:hypothetical protein